MRAVPLVIALALSGCMGFASAPLSTGSVEAGPLGPVIQPNGDGPPIECRGVPRDACEGPGSIEDGMGGIELATVDRVIVSCMGTCTLRGGEFRVDVLIGERTREIARGGWGE